MFGRIMLFELRYQLRRPAFFVSFGIFAALAFLIATGVGLQSTGKGQVDDPTLIKFILGAFSALGMFVPLAIIADVALRDSESRMDELVRAAPVPMTSYMLAKLIGAFVVVCLAFMGAVIGLAVGSRMWWLDPTRIGPFRPDTYARILATFAVPNLFIAGALFFTLATATRSLFATYVGVLLFLPSGPPQWCCSSSRPTGPSPD